MEGPAVRIALDASSELPSDRPEPFSPRQRRKMPQHNIEDIVWQVQSVEVRQVAEVGVIIRLR